MDMDGRREDATGTDSVSEVAAQKRHTDLPSL